MAGGLEISPQPLQVGPDLRCSLVAEVAVFFEGFVDDVFKLRGQVGVEAHGSGGCLVQNGVK